MVTRNGEIAGNHKGVELSTGDVILVPIWKLKQLGYDVTDGVEVFVEVDVVKLPARATGKRR